jgi:hypothetical protein
MNTLGRITASVTLALAGTTGLFVATPVYAATPVCRFPDAKAKVHNEVTRRDTTLTNLMSVLQQRKDPFGLNAGQISALQGAKSGIDAQGTKVQSTCYQTMAQLRADAQPIFQQYRVYWLRVPQTHVIAAADRLGEVRARLGDAASKLAGKVGDNATAKADLTEMQQDVAAADAKLGVAPTPATNIANVAHLEPAVDMTANTAAIVAARTDLRSAQLALGQARVDGLKVVHDLGG